MRCGTGRSAQQPAAGTAEKNITIQLSLDTPVYIIEGDYGRLRQMLLIFFGQQHQIFTGTE